jgi:hypothetical protein
MSNRFQVWSCFAVIFVSGCSLGGDSEAPSAPDQTCRGQIVPSEASCLQDTFCVELESGQWCTGPDERSECPGEVVDSPSRCLLDDAYCYELEGGKWCTGTAAPACPPGSDAIATGNDCPKNFTCWQASESLRCGRPGVAVDRP